jgi:hypothetical protein
MKIDGISAIAVIMIASFAIDRIVTGMLFLLSFLKPWRHAFPDPGTIQDVLERARAEKKQKLIYFIFAGILGILVLAYYGKVRIFAVIGFPQIDWILDTIATGLILVAGADRIAAILNMASGSGVERSAQRPIEITGKLILEEGAAKRISEG